MSERRDAWDPPERIEAYRILSPLGEGRMGRVFLARDERLKRRVAIKFIRSGAISGAAKRRFVREARAAAAVQSPFVASVYGVGEIDSRPYLVTEYVPGRTLEALPKPLDARDVVKIGIGIAEALRALHASGVLHRDVKPANIVVSEDLEPKLLDLGLARIDRRRPGPRRRASPGPSQPPSRTETIVPPGLGPSGTGPLATQDSIDPFATDGFATDPFATDAFATDAFATDAFATDAFATDAFATDAFETQSSQAGVATLTIRHGPSGATTIVPPNLEIQGRELTGAGAVLGTPDYMAPECWRGEPAQPATDLFALGAILYELLTGAPPWAHVSTEELPLVVDSRPPRLTARIASVPARMSTIVDRCLEPSLVDRYPSAEDMLRDLKSLEETTAVEEAPNPYRGLGVFEASDEDVFRGRTREVREVLARLQRRSTVVVCADSGVGKSSLCRAGVIPAITRGALDPSRSWSVALVRLGQRPHAHLIHALRSWWSGATGDSKISPPEAVRGLVSGLGPHRGLVLLVDQLEELVTAVDPEERTRADALLRELTDDVPGVHVLATARSDYLTRLVAMPAFGPVIGRSLFLLTPLSAAQARECIVGPAQKTGTRFESTELVDALAARLEDSPGALPLLQFCLTMLWEARDLEHNVIDQSTLDRIGGVRGALSRHADAVLETVEPGARGAARDLLLQLVHPDGHRVPRDADDLGLADPTRAAALGRLLDGRLVVARRDGDDSVFELAHDALARDWPRLQSWLNRGGELRELEEQLRRQAADWERSGRKDDLLLRPAQLEEAKRLRAPPSGGRVGAFIECSRAHLRRRRIRRTALWAALAASILVAGLGVRWLATREQALRQAELREEGLQALQSGRDNLAVALSGREQAFSAMRSRDRESGERAWKNALFSLQAADADLVRSVGRFEAAAVLDGSLGRDLHLATALVTRAEVARLNNHAQLAAELLDRARLYPGGEEQIAQRSKRGRLSIRSQVREWIELTRHAPRSSHQDATIASGWIESGKPQDWTLPPGAYSVRVLDGSRIRAIASTTIGASEELELAVPPSSGVPEDMVYVAAGRFQYGSTADEESRLGFFDALPLHPRSTAAYLIGRYEVTFGDWIAFLNDQPPADRKTHAPRTGSEQGLTSGDLRLTQHGRGWELEVRTSAGSVRAPSGAPLQFPGRNSESAADWLRFPVLGISAHDAEAYAAWLSRTGRLRGARLCTEAEWERGARGPTARPYPHGARLAPSHANFDLTFGRKSDAMGPEVVGSRPASVSPVGLHDMVGNAFEWTTSVLEEGEYVLKGGSYYYDAKTARISNRAVATPELRASSVGLRLCAAPPETQP